MSYRQIYYQIVFGTTNREATIVDEHCEELYKYVWGIVNNNKCKLYRINGIEDHIHIFSDLHPSMAIRKNTTNRKVFMMNTSGC
jgi:REP element-mobilizing transposase RayT